MALWRDIHESRNSSRNRLACRLQEWLQPFLAVLKRSEQRCWAPLYLQGLLGPGARKSVEPMASACSWPDTAAPPLRIHVASSTAPLEQVLARQLTPGGRRGAALIVDDTALRKQGKHSVGVKRQHCGCWASRPTARC